MKSYFISLLFISLLFSIKLEQIKNNSHCLTDDSFGNFSKDQVNKIKNRRASVRYMQNSILNRNTGDTLLIPIIFHDVYEPVYGNIDRSFCNYRVSLYHYG